MKRFRDSIVTRAAGREDAQAIIFMALVMMLLTLTTGLAIEGGRLYSEHRHLQDAADLAALVGAQSLPCSTSAGACTAAENAACTVAQNHGFSCTAGTNAMVPPTTCSPYDNLDYGNDNGDTGGNPNCKTTTNAVTQYDYIEVSLQDSLGTVPIFNTPVTLFAHAVARHGVSSPKDFAVAQLDSLSGATGIKTGGNSTFFVNGSSFANGPLNIGGGSNTTTACDGGFFTHQTSYSVGSATTYSGGVAGFAPPACYADDGTTLQTTNSNNFDASLPPIQDPYCSSISPPFKDQSGTFHTPTDCDGNSWGGGGYTSSTGYSIPNCIPCTSYGWYYDITSDTWIQDTTSAKDPNFNNSNDYYEMFPGVYGSFQMSANTHMYFNPGVYIFTGSVSFDKGNVCMFGSPICDSGTSAGYCSDTTLSSSGYVYWTPGSSAGSADKGNTWYYHCSPYGFYDTYLNRPASSTGGAASVPCSNTPPPTNGPSCTAPTYWDTTLTNTNNINGGKGGVSTLPINGMTWVFTSTSTKAIGGNGSGASALAYYVPAPNPCPGTGTDKGSHKVSFNNGYASATFDYTSIDNPPDSGSQIPQRAGFTSGTYSGGSNGGKYNSSPIVTGWGGSAATSASQIYPSMDLSINGECSPNNFEVWPGEFGGVKGQHLHFAWFDRQNNLDKFNGNQGQSFLGIIYIPGNNGPNASPAATANDNTFSISGSGASGGGVPFIWGQLIVWDIDYSGSGTVDLIYRPCDNKSEVCASGFGTQLVQ